ncbi:SGNH/GDSL hydrolase family protein [Kitasatospora sp. NA04385]|uniref:SGNH/GDSL hydrolase family protein n=1 Tax=Kitasatospora sp. NA04385 TaxID=2742135 RepID=UPI0015922AFA|nr:SGNH/GDSL hydrolase family protein [Kitasatospora sp. NA04385]QKW23733.1 SGNH/GDSL hydrolase family protein [Kitasatospora sp. NA04385]
MRPIARRRTLVAAALTALALAAAGAVPAAAQDAAHGPGGHGPGGHGRPDDRGRTAYYLALGDSLAAGYQSTPDGGHVVGRGYAQDLARTLGSRAARGHRPFEFTDLGCPGETTGTMADGGCPYPHSFTGSQLAAAVSYLKAHRKDEVLVTIDIGANDVQRCASGGSLDLPCAVNGIEQVRTGLDRILGELRAAAGPRTRIVGMNLYDPFLAAWVTGEQGRELATASVRLSGSLNDAIEGVDARHHVPTADVAGAFATGSFEPTVPLGDQQVPLNVARILQWTNMARGDIHANDAGYQVIADAFLAKLPKCYLN